MSRLLSISGILVASLTLAPSFGLAEEPVTDAAPAAAEQPVATEAEAPEADPAPEAPAAPEAVPAAPEPAPVAPPALKPITITFSGELTAVAASENPPMVTVQDRYGVKKEIAVPSEAQVSSGGAAKSLADLKTSDKVTVEYTYDVATGKRTAQSIVVGEAGSAAQ